MYGSQRNARNRWKKVHILVKRIKCAGTSMCTLYDNVFLSVDGIVLDDYLRYWWFDKKNHSTKCCESVVGISVNKYVG